MALVVPVEEAYVHQVVVEDIVDILDLLAVEGNFEEDIVDVHSVVPLVVDVDYKSRIFNIKIINCLAISVSYNTFSHINKYKILNNNNL